MKLMYGTILSKTDVIEMMDLPTVAEEALLTGKVNEDSLIRKVAKEVDLDCVQDDISWGKGIFYIIGRDYESIKDNETGLEFRQMVEKSINEIVKRSSVCRAIAIKS